MREVRLTSFFSIMLVLLLCPPVQAQQPDFANAEIKWEKLKQGLYVLYGVGPNSNVGLSVGEDGAFIIDAQFSATSDNLVKTIREITDKPIRFVINTHYHRDHNEGNRYFRQAGAMILAHNNVRSRLQGKSIGGTRANISPAPAEELPFITFDETTTMYLNGEEVHLFWTGRAHTDGDIIVYFRQSNVMYSGDVFFNHRFPYIDHAGGGSLSGLLANAEKLIGLIDNDTLLVPGHHKPGNKADLQLFYDTVTRTEREIRALIEAGQSIDDILAAKPFADLYQSWGTNFMTPERYIRILHSDISRLSDK